MKIAKPNGTQAWKLLQDCFKSRERPRIHQLLNNLTNLKMYSQESMRDYLMRAEELQLNLIDVGENVSDQMLCSVVLKGLPNSFASFVTVFKFSHEAKTFADLKRDLFNFDSDSCRSQPEQGTSSHFTKDVKCFKCGKLGHRQSECRAKVSVIVCYECGAKGHKANECPKTKIRSKTGAPRETTQNKRFYTKRSESNLTAEKQGFSFHTCQVHSTCKNIDLLVDSGCTSHMIKDAELFRDLDISKMCNVECANGTESSIEGRGSVSFLAKDNQGQDQILELEQSLYVPNTQKT